MDKSSTKHSTPFDPAQIWAELKRRKWLVLAILVLGTAATVAYTSAQPILFKSTASVLIDTFVPTAKGMDNNYPDLSISQDVMKAQRSLAESTPVRDAARQAAQQKLHEAPTADDVDYQTQTDGQLLYLIVFDTNPKRAAEYANQWAVTFCDYMRRRSSDPATEILNQYNIVVPALREKWMTAQKARSDFEGQEHFDPKEFERDPIHQKIAKLNTDALDLSRQLVELRKQREWLDSLKPLTNEAVWEIPGAATDVFLKSAKDEVDRNKLALSDLLLKEKPDSEPVLSRKATLHAAELDLDAAVKGFLLRFDGQLHILEARYNDVLAELKKAEDLKQKTLVLSWKWARLDQAEKDAEQDYKERSHDKFTADFSKPFVGSYAKPWEIALESKIPALPNWRRNLIGGILSSAVLAALMVMLLDRLDDSVRTAAELPKRAGVISIGSIPASELALPDSVVYRMVEERGFSMIAEALRNLHISLEVKYDNRRRGKALVITVTSALANEGKTMVSSNLALLFAGLGRKTLLVDADLRKRSLSKTYGIESAGLAEVMNGMEWQPGIVSSVSSPNLSLLSAGILDSNTPTSFKPERFHQLLAYMTSNYEVIIFDTPPILPMADATIMGHASDVTLLVVRSRKTTLRQMDTALVKLEEAKVKDVFCVVNGVESIDTYGYSGGQIYGYGLSERMAESSKQPRIPAAKIRADHT